MGPADAAARAWALVRAQADGAPVSAQHVRVAAADGTATSGAGLSVILGAATRELVQRRDGQRDRGTAADLRARALPRRLHRRRTGTRGRPRLAPLSRATLTRRAAPGDERGRAIHTPPNEPPPSTFRST